VGRARVVVRLVQDARKGDGLQVSDRISLRWRTADGDLARALTEHGALISAEVLAGNYGESAELAGPGEAGEMGEMGEVGEYEHIDTGLGLTFWISPLSGSGS
jgi:isoleucyl-tRNA synthetase